MTLRLYAIVNADPKVSLGRGIAVLRSGGSWIVVGAGETPPATAEALVAHDRVVRRAAKHVSAILPLRFGSTAPDQKTLSARLKPLAQAIREGLVLVNDAVQLTLRVMGKPAPRRRIDRKAGPGTRYLAKLRAKYEVPEIEPLTEAVKPLVRAVRAERKDKPPLLASAYHLVPRQNVRAWRAAVARVRPELDVELTITGPWPPYAFAEL